MERKEKEKRGKKQEEKKAIYFPWYSLRHEIPKVDSSLALSMYLVPDNSGDGVPIHASKAMQRRERERGAKQMYHLQKYMARKL